MKNTNESLLSRMDWPLFICAVLIALLGVLNLYSATSVFKDPKQIAVAERYISQLYWLLGSGIFGAILCAIDYRHIERYAYVIYGIGIFSLVLVFVFARDVRGSHRWIEFGSFRFQPSEFTKLGLIVALAKYLHDDPKNEGRSLKDLIVPAIITGIPFVLILKQPDLGTACVHAFIFLTIAALTKLRTRSALTFLGTATVALWFMWSYLLLGYQKNRIEVFLDPESDLLGKGWHAYQSRIAIGNGGLFGQGYLKGTQNQFNFIGEQSTDFPFPVYAEEWGFAGSLVLMGLYMFLALWSIRIASQARDRFGAVLSVGCAAMIFWHTIINVSMTCGLMPVVGVTLPLFSYGGSSVSNNMLGLAFLMSVSLRRNVVRPERF
ncbi:MAG: rod shape-determining protein RodA [Polyangiaceae bacterium]